MMLRPCLDTLSARARLETPSTIQSVLFRMKDSRSCAYGGAQVPPVFLSLRCQDLTAISASAIKIPCTLRKALERSTQPQR